MEGHRNCFGRSSSRPSTADDEASGWAKKAGHTCCGRVKESAGRTRKACDRGYVDGADGGRAREHVKITPIDDGMARRVGARSEEGEKVAAIVCLQARVAAQKCLGEAGSNRSFVYKKSLGPGFDTHMA